MIFTKKLNKQIKNAAVYIENYVFKSQGKLSESPTANY